MTVCLDVRASVLQSMLGERRCHVVARFAGTGHRSRGRQRPALGAVVEVLLWFLSVDTFCFVRTSPLLPATEPTHLAAFCFACWHRQPGQ